MKLMLISTFFIGVLLEPQVVDSQRHHWQEILNSPGTQARPIFFSPLELLLDICPHTRKLYLAKVSAKLGLLVGQAHSTENSHGIILRDYLK